MSKKYTLEDVQLKINKLFPNEDITVLTYDGMSKPITLQCNSCGKIFTHSTGRSYLGCARSCGCAYCQSTANRRHKEILEQIKKDYEILDISLKVENSGRTREIYTIKCKKCGHIRKIRFSSFPEAPNCGCQEHSRYFRRTAEEFLQEINSKCIEGEYQLLSEYVDTKTKVLLKHSCGFIWSVRPSALLKNHNAYCPRCGKKESQGEKIIDKILTELSIPHEREKQLINSKCRFDFYFQLNGFSYAVEYNGKQHYVYTPHFTKTVEDFNQLVARDKYKQEYCKQHNIKLLILPYTLSKEQIQAQIESFIGSTTTVLTGTE